MAESESREEQLIQQFTAERDESRAQFTRRTDELYEEIAQIQRDRDERLLLAENDKQQVAS